jgi:hypothetical protein
MSDELNYLDELLKAQEFLGNINLEVSISNPGNY